MNLPKECVKQMNEMSTICCHFELSGKLEKSTRAYQN